ncbi:MAG: RHS repeat-associated core domain-containing protein [Nanoarchaeota archaeon]
MHKDYLGSISLETDNKGNSIFSQNYLPFGQDIPGGLELDVNTHKYVGQELDAETGLYHFGARYYDPTTGRFTQTDPILHL